MLAKGFGKFPCDIRGLPGREDGEESVRRLAIGSRTISALVVICAAVPLLGLPGKKVRWPVIQPMQEVFAIEDPDKAFIQTFIRDPKGRALYLFVCRTGEVRTVPDLIYTNDLDCRLTPAEVGETGDTLLVEEHGLRAWYSRGRMMANELYGECGAYPEYGRVRHFRLRGMRLTLEFLDVQFAAPPAEIQKPVLSPPSKLLASYKVRLTVERDPTATRDIAGWSGYLTPSRVGRSCSQVLRGIEWPGSALTVLEPQPRKGPWPAIRPMQEVFAILDPDRAVIRTFIRGPNGQSLYLFVCRTGEGTSIPGLTYLNALDCRLIPARFGEVQANLLVEDPHQRAWVSRGRMLALELYEGCGAYPEYGRVRHFRLRGMKLTLEFFAVRFTPDHPGLKLQGPPSTRLVSYKLRLTVQPDPAAHRYIAAPSGYLNSFVGGPSCDTVQKGIEWKGE